MLDRNQPSAAQRDPWNKGRLTKAAQTCGKTGNLRAVELLLGHTKVESTVRYSASK